MQHGNILLFPTEILTFKFNVDEIRPLINEVVGKKDQIKKINSIYNKNGGQDDYYSDFSDPVKLFEYEKLMLSVSNYFHGNNIPFFMKNYWTAIYHLSGLHDKHVHTNFVKGEDANYSSVLYLTNMGETLFHNPNPTCIYDNEFVKSEVGKLIFFPSNLLHSAENFIKGERMIISSNVILRR